MRILGIDPGLRTTGFGVINVDGSRLSYVASGTISTTHIEKGQLPARLKVLFEGVKEVMARYEPDSASVEIVFVNVNPQSTLLLGQARGAVVTALVSADLPVAEYTALQMKQAVVGYGRADKTQVQEMVKRLLNLPGLPGSDAADALGLAITHAHAGAGLARRRYRSKDGFRKDGNCGYAAGSGDGYGVEQHQVVRGVPVLLVLSGLRR